MHGAKSSGICRRYLEKHVVGDSLREFARAVASADVQGVFPAILRDYHSLTEVTDATQ